MEDPATEHLNSWTSTRRLPRTFRAAMNYAVRNEPKASQCPEGNRIPRPKMSWKETSAWLGECGKRAALVKPKTMPVAYSDPASQAAFERIYGDKLYLLRVPAEEA
jgi:hypothetical protein